MNPDDPYEQHSWADDRGVEYRERLRQRGCLDDLSTSDARRVGEQIAELVVRFAQPPAWWIGDAVGGFGEGLTDKRVAEELHNRSVNASVLADGQDWDDPQSVGRAFAAATTALTLQPEEDTA